MPALPPHRSVLGSRMSPLGILLFAMLSLVVGRGVPVVADDASYEAGIKEWRAKREQRLRNPEGYLALTGLFWLSEGQFSFGSASDNDLVFPGKNVPQRIGYLQVAEGIVSVRIEPGVDVRCAGDPVTSLRLFDDQDSDHETTVLALGTLSWYVIRRAERVGIRLKDSESPTLLGFAGVDSYPVDRRWRIEGRFDPYEPMKLIPIVSVGDIRTNEPCSGAIVFEVGGEEYRLDAIGRPGAEQFFVIFADETNAVETYGAGRFVYVDAPDAAHRIVIDFNKAYNPPCAFSDYTTCPLPPEQNRLPFRVTAGEKAYGHHGSRP